MLMMSLLFENPAEPASVFAPVKSAFTDSRTSSDVCFDGLMG
jgi:hypothetical protein